MSVTERLRSLDGRVLGRRRPVTARKHRTGFLVGTSGTLVVVVAAVLSGWSGVLAGAGGFVGMALASGFRWWESGPPDRRRTAAVALGSVVVVVAVGAALATMSDWDRDEPAPAGGQLRPAEPTQFVQCDETARGRGYSYQAPVTAPLRCENGATPRVLLRP